MIAQFPYPFTGYEIAQNQINEVKPHYFLGQYVDVRQII